jgi:hypothetical protein
MDLSRISRSELIGAVASAALVISLFFLPWYDLAPNPQRDAGEGFICGTGEYSCTGFETFPILRWLLIGAAAAPLILSWILARGHKLSWQPGEMTMVVGFTAFVLILYNGVIDRPGSQIEEIGVSLAIGYWIALIAAAGISAAGVGRTLEAQRGALRKAPGTV